MRRPAESAFDLHRLIHIALRKWLQKQELLNQWIQKAIKRLLEVFPDHNHGNRSKWRRLLPHTKYALSYNSIEQEDESRMNLEWKYAMVLYVDGRYNEAEEPFMRAMETRKRVLGEEHPDTLTSMNNLAWTWKSCSRDAEALELITKCQQLLQSRLGDLHPNTLACTRTMKSWISK